MKIIDVEEVFLEQIAGQFIHSIAVSKTIVALILLAFSLILPICAFSVKLTDING